MNKEMLSIKELKPRDIISYVSNSGVKYCTIIEKSVGSGFYMYYSDNHGNPTQEEIYHTNMIFEEEVEKVGELDDSLLVENRYEGFSWYESSEYEWINEQLSSVGQKYKVFSHYASPADIQYFENNESRNAHRENRLFVNKFIQKLMER